MANLDNPLFADLQLCCGKCSMMITVLCISGTQEQPQPRLLWRSLTVVCWCYIGTFHPPFLLRQVAEHVIYHLKEESGDTVIRILTKGQSQDTWHCPTDSHVYNWLATYPTVHPHKTHGTVQWIPMSTTGWPHILLSIHIGHTVPSNWFQWVLLAGHISYCPSYPTVPRLRHLVMSNALLHDTTTFSLVPRLSTRLGYCHTLMMHKGRYWVDTT